MTFNVLSEKSVKLFCFYLEGSLCEGIRYRNRLYTLVKTLKIGDHYGMRETCEDLRQRQRPCLITRSRHQYRVWTDVRTHVKCTAISPQGSGDEMSTVVTQIL
jgi:hypothetical protein